MPNSAAPGPTFLGDMNSVDDFLRPQQKNKFVEFLIGFFLPFSFFIIVCLLGFVFLIIAALNDNLGAGAMWAFVIVGSLSLTVIPLKSINIAFRSSNTTTARRYGAISVLIISIIVIFYIFLWW